MANSNAAPDPKFEALLEYLRRNRGFDFGGYKRSSLIRRVQKRMSMLGVTDFAEYIDYLEVHPGEFEQLFNTILINVTSFFRDADAWHYLRTEILPKILAADSPDGQIRIWSAGCASGEEAYTIAMLLCEVLTPSEFQRRVKIYATDIDEDALQHARQASYTDSQVEGLDPDLLDKYFTQAEGKYIMRSELRRAVIFGRHDLVQDAPISHLDLLICRNTLMYLNAETQSRIIARMHFALKPTGYLFLGKAEMLLSYANLFTQADLRFRVFSKVNKLNLRDRLLVMAQAGDADCAAYLNQFAVLRDLSMENMVQGQIVIDSQGILRLVNNRARLLFGMQGQEINQPFQDLEISYRPIELRSLIDQCYREERPIRSPIVAHQSAGSGQLLDVIVTPLLSDDSGIVGVSITFEDVSAVHALHEELRSAHEELQTTNDELQSTNEELETTNEELQSTNEELETTNEELQSTNEELETTNEELQSTNEELETTNEELQSLSEEGHRTNIFLESILSSMDSAVIVVDAQLNVRVWNHHAEELWGLRADEVLGNNFIDLDFGLPTKPVGAILSDNLDAGQWRETQIDGVNRRGRKLTCTVRVTPLGSADRQEGSVIFVEEARAAK